jgi:hypothetical protein
MDDLIYIIVLIAWVLYAFYRKSQKKSSTAREAPRRTLENPEPEVFPTLEEILLGREPEPAPEPEPVVYTPATSTDGVAPVLKETSFEKEYNLKGLTSIEEMDKPMTIRELNTRAKEQEVAGEEDVETGLWRDRVNLRHAVIYSEILNRPYI